MLEHKVLPGWKHDSFSRTTFLQVFPNPWTSRNPITTTTTTTSCGGGTKGEWRSGRVWPSFYGQPQWHRLKDKSRGNAKCSLCACSPCSNTKRQPMRWRRRGLLGKMARSEDERTRSDGKRRMDGWMDTYCCRECRSRTAGADHEHWGAPSSFPLPDSLTLLLSCFCCPFPPLLYCCLFSLPYPWKTAFISQEEAQRIIWGKTEKKKKMSKDTPGSNRRACERASWRSVLVSGVCDWKRERKQQAGDDHRRPLLGEGRSTPSFSLVCSLTPIHPSSLSLALALSLLIQNKQLSSLARSLSLSVKAPAGVQKRCIMTVSMKLVSRVN